MDQNIPVACYNFRSVQNRKHRSVCLLLCWYLKFINSLKIAGGLI